VFERFTEPARQVVVFAQDEATALKHNYIGTEHILLGLLRQRDGDAAQALASLGIRLEDMRAEIVAVVGEGDERITGQLAFTPRAKRALELAAQEARALGQEHLAPEHILLGVVRRDDGIANQILLARGSDSEQVREEVLRQLKTTVPPDYEKRMKEAQRSLERSRLLPYIPLIVGTLLLFGAGVGFGILIGWKIWA